MYMPTLKWEIARLLWIGYLKNNDNPKCLLPKLPKDIIIHILSFQQSQLSNETIVSTWNLIDCYYKGYEKVKKNIKNMRGGIAMITICYMIAIIWTIIFWDNLGNVVWLAMPIIWFIIGSVALPSTINAIIKLKQLQNKASIVNIYKNPKKRQIVIIISKLYYGNGMQYTSTMLV